jgi:uncharacterized protein (DUF608 family)
MAFTYEGAKIREISFPLGGIGTGCIGLAGNGRLVDWEIFNHPAKGTANGFTHIAVKAEAQGRVVDARALQGDMAPPFTGLTGGKHFDSYGFGPNRDTLMGMPHFRDVRFEAQFPFATVHFGGERFPGRVSLRAFNPFIPLNDSDSSLPVALFEVAFENTGDIPLRYSACFTLSNPLAGGRAVNRHESSEGLHRLRMSAPGQDSASAESGDLTLATDAEDVCFQEYWYRGMWFDSLGMFWRDFNRAGSLANRTYPVPKLSQLNAGADPGSLCASVEVAPGQTGRVRFALGWSFPNHVNTWNPDKGGACGPGCECAGTPANQWKNHYATRFEDSSDSVRYAFRQWERLERESRLFSDAMHRSSLPAEALDAVTANLATLKSPTCLRLTDGSFYGFEGCHCDEGCCEGSCTHVWNYAYALPFLFPALERSMRDLDYRYNQGPDGGMGFRLQLPVGRARSPFRPCADGQFGGVVKAYRDWRISGDDAWLRSIWPAIRRSIAYAWHPDNADRWDPDRSGVLTGRQHHTLDMELFGANSWLTGFYLAALKAGAEMADAMGEPDCAAEFRSIFARGKEWVERRLFNGEYYHQDVDVRDRGLLKPFEADPALHDTYWNAESSELKYQIGDGCAVDQVVAQWHANLCGLGEIFDPERTASALASIYRYNFKKDMRDFFNPCRIFAAQDEGGVVICEWPDPERKPKVPLTYAEECMNGFEYQVAVHMIQTGMVEEGMEIVRAIRHRYDGERRNPFNEFECGSNYARSMASYSLLLAFSGFLCDGTRGSLRFAPIQETFRGFWSVDGAWGEFAAEPGVAVLSVLYGRLELRELVLPKFGAGAASMTLDGSGLEHHRSGDAFVPVRPLCIGAEQVLEIRLAPSMS